MKQHFHSTNNLVIKNNIQKWSWGIARFILLFGLCFILVYPILYMVSNALRPVADNYDPTVIWIPKSITMQNFKDAIKILDYRTVFTNTIMIAGVTAIIQVVSSMFIGYGFARFKFYGRNLLFMLVLLTIIVPPQVMSIPSYLNYRFFDFFGLLKLTGIGEISLIDSNWVFYLPAVFGVGLRSGLFIFIFRQFFRGLPKELEDASLIDGCGAMNTFIRIMVPNAVPPTITVIIFSIVWQWNDYYNSAMYLSEKMTLSMALSLFQNNLSQLPEVGADFIDFFVVSTRIQAASLLTVLPILLMYLFLQRYFVESVERSGIVG